MTNILTSDHRLVGMWRAPNANGDQGNLFSVDDVAEYLAQQTFMGRGVFNVMDPTYGAKGDGVTDDTAAIGLAEAAAFAAGGQLYFQPGLTYNIGTSGLTIRVPIAPGSEGATLSYSGTGTAVTFGNTTSGSQLRKVTAHFPKIVQSLKTTTGWAQAGGADIGLKIINVYESELHVPHIKNFAYGLYLTGLGTGCVYNNITLGHLETNKINLALVQGTAGWVNQNTFHSGRSFFDAGEGTAVSGAKHVYLARGDTTYGPPDTNVFVNLSTEGDVAEYNLDCHGSYNIFTFRWESTSPTALFTKDADGQATCFRNRIVGGYKASGVAITQSGGAIYNGITTADKQVLTGSEATRAIQYLHNGNASTAAVERVIPASGDPHASSADTGWTEERSASYTKYKATGDSVGNHRIEIDKQNGKVRRGFGTAPPLSLTDFVSVASKTANYTVTLGDDVVEVDATSGVVTLTLPGAGGSPGKVFTFKKVDASANAVNCGTVDGAALSLTTQWQVVTIYSNGSAWRKKA